MRLNAGISSLSFFLKQPGSKIFQVVIIIRSESDIKGFEPTMAFLKFENHFRANFYIAKTYIPKPALVKKYFGTIICLNKSKT